MKNASDSHRLPPPALGLGFSAVASKEEMSGGRHSDSPETQLHQMNPVQIGQKARLRTQKQVGVMIGGANRSDLHHVSSKHSVTLPRF